MRMFLCKQIDLLCLITQQFFTCIPISPIFLLYIFTQWRSSQTWPTRSGIPSARSISSKPRLSVLLSRESSWSSRARSSLCPSVVDGGTSRSSRGLPNCKLNRHIKKKIIITHVHVLMHMQIYKKYIQKIHTKIIYLK